MNTNTSHPCFFGLNSKDGTNTSNPSQKEKVFYGKYDITFLSENEFAFVQTLIHKSLGQEIKSALLQEYTMDDIIGEYYFRIYKHLKNYDENKSKLKTFIIGFANTKMKYYVKKMLYNKKGVVYYKYTELDQLKFKDLYHHEFYRIDNTGYFEEKFEDGDYLCDRYEFMGVEDISEEEKEIDDMKYFIFSIIQNLETKYGEKTIRRFKDYFYKEKDDEYLSKNKDAKPFSPKQLNLFKEIESEILEEVTKKKGLEKSNCYQG